MKKCISVILICLFLCNSIISAGAIEWNVFSGDNITNSVIETSPVNDVATSDNTEHTEPTESNCSMPTQESTVELPTSEPSTEISEPITEPITIPETIVNLKTSAVTLYVGETESISVNIKNSVGATRYSSSNSKIATVSSKGKVKAIKKGSVYISVTNNGVTATLKVTVKNPKLNYKKLSLRTTKVNNFKKTEKLKIIGKVKGEKVSFKSANPRIARVSKKGKVKAITPGKVIIKARYLGKTYKCVVSVKKPTEFEKYVKYKVVFKLKKKALTKNVGTPNVCVDDLIDFHIENNLSKLLKKGVSVNKLNKWNDKIYKIVGKVKYKLIDSSIAQIKGDEIIPVKKGKTMLKATLKNQIILLPVKITKIKETTYNNKRSRVVYSDKEAYGIIKDTFYNFILKGEEPYYGSMTCLYNASKLESKIEEYALKESDNGENFIYYIPQYLFGAYSFIKWAETDEGLDVWVFEQDKNIKNEFALLYNEGEKILSEINFDSYNSLLERMFALKHWFEKTCSYDTELSGIALPEFYVPEYYIIIHHVGVCENYARATVYLCTLRKIPCKYIVSSTHAWNAVKYKDKWYHLDLLNSVFFRGDKKVLYKDFETRPEEKLDFSKENLLNESEENTIASYVNIYATKDNGVYYVFDIEYSQDFFNKILGWNGVEQVDCLEYQETLNKIYRGSKVYKS